jgi:hypothetical protein
MKGLIIGLIICILFLTGMILLVILDFKKIIYVLFLVFCSIDCIKSISMRIRKL